MCNPKLEFDFIWASHMPNGNVTLEIKNAHVNTHIIRMVPWENVLPAHNIEEVTGKRVRLSNNRDVHVWYLMTVCMHPGTSMKVDVSCEGSAYCWVRTERLPGWGENCLNKLDSESWVSCSAFGTHIGHKTEEHAKEELKQFLLDIPAKKYD